MAFIEKPSGYLTLKSLMASLPQLCSAGESGRNQDYALNAIFAHS
jgi:hypothetical protein